MKGPRIAVLFVLLALLVPAIGSAITEYGCFDCGSIGLDEYCSPAGEGSGWECHLIQLADGLHVCYVLGGACLNPDYGGGGGGTGGGGGGGGCSGISGFCPAACFSCSGGRPRI